MNDRLAAAAPHPVPDAHGQNLYTIDHEFAALLALYLPADLMHHLTPHLHQLGAQAGARLDDLARQADQHPPTLEHRTRSGLDAQRVVKHPAYQELERVAFSHYGLAAMSHRGGVLGWPAPLPPLAKYALSYLLVQAEFGLCCPLSMSDSLTRTLRKFGAPELIDKYLAALTSQDMDELAQGAMFMTEQAAGSDLAATATRAVADAALPAGAYRLHGDKWFCSNPDAALAMVLARIDDAPAGLAGVSLFLLPRQLDDGSFNAFRIIRLKDKLGTRSMASGEIRLEGAQAWLVGAPGQGFKQMADMINNSRLSNGMRAAGLMRRACTEALFVARERRAFGQRLIDLPLMRRQLLKILLPTEAARSVLLQTAETLRRADAGEALAAPLLRILTPLIKFRACRDARRVTGDAMEVRGGCGYIEEFSDARLLRDAHLGSIWEGTSNIVALDVVRAIRRERALPALVQHWQQLLGDAALHPAARQTFEATLLRVQALAQQVADAGAAGEHAARQAASALYYATAACAMAWEATRIGSARRMGLAQALLRLKLLPADPLAERAEVPGLAGLLEAHGLHSAAAVPSINLF